MAGVNALFLPGGAKNINLVCLLLAVCFLLFLPLKKEMWYDESISVLISNGFSHETAGELSATQSVSSETLAKMNTSAMVYKATVIDNGNSFIYNIALHYFCLVCGKSIGTYLWFSKLWGAASLLAFFTLCNLLFEGSIFTALALVLFLTDKVFWGMGHEIRGYQMGIFFIIMATVYCYKFLYRQEKSLYLLLTGLFCVGAVLSHYLSVYAILVLVAYLIFTKKAALFSAKNVGAMLLPVALVGIYLAVSISGFQKMSNMNAHIKEKSLTEGFSIVKALILSLKFTSANFKIAFTAFKDATPVILIAFAIIAALYFAALKLATSQIEKRNLNFLVILGVSGTILLAALSIKSQHYTALYFRYYSFCVPFSTLATAYMLKIFFTNARVNKIMAAGIATVVFIPCIAIFALSIIKHKPELSYNHIAIAAELVKSNISTIEIPDWRDAMMIQSFLPANKNVQYLMNTSSQDFVLHTSDGLQKIPVIRLDN
ncbi:MAG: hypothetical protein H7257_07615 [Taibaiella sp.]|nr:hypothetical protein [Taibaiella sp.]